VSVCLNCLAEFKPTRNSKGLYCSFQCWKTYEKVLKLRGGFVRMNLGKVIEEMDVYSRDSRERSKIFVSELSKKGKQNLVEGYELQLKYLKGLAML